MLISKKFFLFSAFLVAVFFTTVSLVTRIILIKNLKNVEVNNTKYHTQRVIGSLNTIMESIATINADYARWDDTYNFIQNRNSDFISSNIVLETFEGIGVNLMVFVDTEGKVVFEKRYDFETKKEKLINEQFYKYLSPTDPLVNLKSETDGVLGVILVDNKPLIVSSKPILQSDGSGPVKGALVVGRYIDKDIIKRVENIAQLPITIHDFNNNDLGINAALVKEQVVLKTEGSQKINGYTTLNDIYNKPILIVGASLPRDIYTQGLVIVKYLSIMLIVLGTLSLILSAVFINRAAVVPLQKLTNDVKSIINKKDTSARVKVRSKDEVGILAEEINKMLTHVELAEFKLENTNKELTEKTKDLEKINGFMVDRELEMARLKQEIQKLQNK